MSRASAIGRLLSLLAVAVLFFGAGGTATSASALAAPSAETEDAVRGAVLGSLFDPAPSPSRQTGLRRSKPDPVWRVYFVEVEKGKDPDPRLLKRFEGHDPPVKPRSAAVIDKQAASPTRYIVKDRDAQEVGVIYTVGRLHWLNRHRVEMAAGWYSGMRAAMGAVFTVAYEKGQWHVKRVGKENHS